MHRMRKCRHGGIMRASPVNDRGQSAWQHERERREKANVPFEVAFALRDLGERPNAARCEIVDPGARFGYGEENRVLAFLFERRFGFGPMQNSLDGRKRWHAPRQADDGGAGR
jgi:hypothetical protein